MRKTKAVTVGTEGRDKGKAFLITEMPATQTEKWCARVLTAIGRAGMDIPEEAMSAPTAVVMALGAARALVRMDFADAEPLIDEMMACVQIIPDPAHPAVVRNLIPDDTEEVATRLALRKEVIELHLGFTLAEATSKMTERIQAMVDSMRTRTSPPLSDAQSQAG